MYTEDQIKRILEAERRFLPWIMRALWCALALLAAGIIAAGWWLWPPLGGFLAGLIAREFFVWALGRYILRRA